ncbi:MAG: DNA-directed RNA polymerase subunit beta' [Candidatus Nasuia deltocephalinicola]
MIIKKKNNKSIKISIFSSEQILNFSYGKIKNYKTLNYKNYRPERGGLFCDKIYGSTDKNCSCGRIFSYDDFSFICKHCGVETSVKDDNSKRTRIAHIELNDYFLNPLYCGTLPNYLSLITGLSKININNILYNNYYFVLYSSLDFLKIGQILPPKDYFFYKEKYFNKFYANTGFNCLSYIVNNLSIKDTLFKIKNSYKSFNSKKLKKISYNKNLKKYVVLKDFFYKNISINNIFLKNLPVLPPDLRPIVNISDKTTVSSDLNELYKRIIKSNIRFKEIKDSFFAPNDILLKERKILQTHINNLFLGGGKTFNKPLKSLLDNLKGKTGYFRNNLLGKRVDYSGRAVIVSGANLRFGECAIPKVMAMEIFRPFIYNEILKNYDLNIRIAREEVDKCSDLALTALISVIKSFYVILNRAPTLHKLGVQAFKILLTDDKAIKLHPLVCAAFNADFDGDQMAVHIPISVKSNIEFKNLLFSGNNILYPANGTCCISPTKDIVLGIYNFTKFNSLDFNNNKYVFNSILEAIKCFNYGFIDLSTIIYFRIKEYDSFGLIYKIYKTSLSRFIIFNYFPKDFSYSFLNRILDKKKLSEILDNLSYTYDFSFIYNLCDNLMRVGFFYSTKFGCSISIDDMFFIYNKKNILDKFWKSFSFFNFDYSNFLLTKNTKKKNFLDLWETASEIVSSNTILDLSTSRNFDNNNIFLKTNSFNSLYSMMISGARGSETQVKQICSNKGVVSYKKLGILEIPIQNSLRDGLNVFEYFYSTHNSRKTLADTALKTSSAGYLTRRLVEVSNNIFISEYDCKTNKGISIKTLIKDGEVIEDFFERIFGRTLLNDFCSKGFFLQKNTLIDYEVINILKISKIDNIYVRSPIRCKSKKGVCTLCYGLDLGKGKIVCRGEMVGIIAAQSIGEPGTQLTMRTFHSGGVVNRLIRKSFYSSNSDGIISYSSSLKYILNSDGFKIVVSKVGKIRIFNFFGKELEYFNIPYSSHIFFDNNSTIKKGDIICKWDSENNCVILENSGFLKFNEFHKNLNYIKSENLNFYEIINNKIMPNIDFYDINNNFIRNYSLNSGDRVFFNNNDKVNVGDIIIKTPLNIVIADDIIGGLPKVDNFFEARIPKNSAVLSPVKGFIKFTYLKKKKILNIVDKNNNIIFNMFLKNEELIVFEDQVVDKGDILIDGELNPHDILYLHGVDYLVDFLLGEIKYIYFSQGVKIGDKHIEIIISQMLKMGIVVSSGKSNFIPGEILQIKKIKKFNRRFKKISKNKIKYNISLTGITNQSLKCDSFLSSASFQKTNQVLSSSAIKHSVDKMKNLKNVVMTGEVFIAGIGGYSKILKC